MLLLVLGQNYMLSPLLLSPRAGEESSRQNLGGSSWNVWFQDDEY